MTPESYIGLTMIGTFDLYGEVTEADRVRSVLKAASITTTPSDVLHHTWEDSFVAQREPALSVDVSSMSPLPRSLPPDLDARITITIFPIGVVAVKWMIQLPVANPSDLSGAVQWRDQIRTEQSAIYGHNLHSLYDNSEGGHLDTAGYPSPGLANDPFTLVDGLRHALLREDGADGNGAYLAPLSPPPVWNEIPLRVPSRRRSQNLLNS